MRFFFNYPNGPWLQPLFQILSVYRHGVGRLIQTLVVAHCQGLPPLKGNLFSQTREFVNRLVRLNMLHEVAGESGII